MAKGTFGIRVVYKNGRKDFYWYIEKALRDIELKRYRRNWAVSSAKKISR